MSQESQVDLVVTGMTCSSCAARIERKLNKLDGVQAAVNYATGIARVQFGSSLQIPDLVDAVEAAGYHALPPNPLLDQQVAELEKAHERDLLQRWQVGAAFAIPVTAISMIHSLQFENWQWLALLLATPVVVWAAWPLHMASFKNARYRTTTMDTLVSIGIIAAYVGSFYQLMRSTAGMLPHVYIDVATIVPVFVLLGRWLEARNKRAAGAALRALADAAPKTALVQTDTGFETREIAEVQIGEVVKVLPETTIPVDGFVLEGTSSVSNALLTGESLPVTAEPGTDVKAGALNHEGEVLVQVTAAGSASTISRIASLVAAAQSGKANIARLADRISGIFVPIVLTIAIATGLVWWFIDSSKALDVVIAVLVIACPCALGLATPTALVVGSGKAASIGVLVAGPQVFEQSRDLDVVVFDKTGTLTLGEMQVVSTDLSGENALIVAALADRSSHPVSAAVNKYFADSTNSDDGNQIDLNKVVAVPGLGIRAELNGHKVEFGSSRFHPEIDLPKTSTTTSWLFIDDAVVGQISVADQIDPSATQTVRRLQALGIRVLMASGDQSAVAEKIALELGISDFYAELTPADKIDVIKNLQADGLTVAMVGDGSNDAPALAQADFAIAMGRGTGIAQATADITLLRPDLNLIPQSIDLARRTLRTIKVNLGWAFGYNVAAIPLAMTGNLNPVIAGIAMSASSVLVVTNSLRLRRS